MSVVITLMGGFAAMLDDGPVDPSAWRRRHASSLVKLLALAPGRRLHREQVIDLLWPELSPSEAAPRLHKAAHYARRALDDPMSLVLAGETGRTVPRSGDPGGRGGVRAAARAALSAGDPVAAGRAADGYPVICCPRIRTLNGPRTPRERLRSATSTCCDWPDGGSNCWPIEPADEQAHLALITRLARSGDRRGALRQFERLELALRRELGVRPSREAVALRTRLLAAPADAQTGPGTASGVRTGPLLVGAASARRSVEKSLDAVDRRRRPDAVRERPGGGGQDRASAGLDRREAARRGMRVGSGVAAQVEGAWPYAPVLEALADLSRRHPALLDGLDDELRKEIESGAGGPAGGVDGSRRAPAAVRRGGRTGPARRRYRRGPGRRRRRPGRRRQPAVAALPGPRCGRRADRHRGRAPSLAAETGDGRDAPQPDRPRHVGAARPRPVGRRGHRAAGRSAIVGHDACCSSGS